MSNCNCNVNGRRPALIINSQEKRAVANGHGYRISIRSAGTRRVMSNDSLLTFSVTQRDQIAYHCRTRIVSK